MNHSSAETVGARGSFWVTQAAAGIENSLRIRVSGALGSLEWALESSQQLSVKPLGEPAQLRTPNGPGTLPLAARSSRIAAGHPEGFREAFANLYLEAGQAIASRQAGKAPDPLTQQFPGSLDGLRGMQFIEAVLRSNATQGAWTCLPGMPPFVTFMQ